MEDIETRLNNRSPECGQDHTSSVTIGLEHGGFITVPASAIRKTERKPRRKPSKPKPKSHVLTPNIFWPEEEEEEFY